MKKKLLTLVLLLSTVAVLSAYTDSYSIYSNSEWDALLRAIKENKAANEVESIYNKYTSTTLSDVETARAEYNMVRYYMDNDNKDKAKEHFKKQEEAVERLSGDNSVLADISRADLKSSDYYISGDMFTGMENSSLTKKLLENYPDEVCVIITNAWRLIYTPQIAGGSNKNAIKILTPLLSLVNTLSEENRYSLYGALAYASYNRHDYTEAKEFLSEALNIYNGEITLLELKEKLDKK